MCFTSLFTSLFHRHANRSEVWIDNLTDLEDTQYILDYRQLASLSPDVWSFFEYINPCVPESDANYRLRVPIEPIVGLMRHPYTPSPCVPPGKATAGVGSLDYMLVHAMVSDTVAWCGDKCVQIMQAAFLF